MGALLSAALSGVTGYALAKFEFPGRALVFNSLIAGVLVPAVMLEVPQYLLLAEVGLTDGYLSVLIPSILSPYGIYLARIYAAASVPDDVVEAARTDGAGEARILGSIALPMMLPGLVTVFLFRFGSIWNNFLLPFIMFGDERKAPSPRPLHAAQPGQHGARALHARGDRLAGVRAAPDRPVPAAPAVLADRPAVRRCESMRAT
ncbi:carbohydrate ABC transporter permease [Saccharothrix hoggarensis]